MISINGENIEYIDELREHFDLKKLVPLIKDILQTPEMFEFENGQLYKEALNEVYAADDIASFTLDNTSDGKICLKLSCKDLPIYSTSASAFNGLNEISKQEALKLILSEMANCEYEVIGVKKDNSSEDLRGKLKIQSGEMKNFPTFESQLNVDERINVFEIENISPDGHAYIILNRTGEEDLIYQLYGGTRLFLLTEGNRVINKLPQLSAGPNHICYLNYFDENKVRVINKDLKRETASQIFDAEKLYQICADDNNGFLLLYNGEILSFSTDFQPDDLEDLLAFLPVDEKIVMIEVMHRQIFILTDKGNVYSNFKIDIPKGKKVIWLKKESDGTVGFIYSGEIFSPKDMDETVYGSSVVKYKNGKIEK